jgi:arylsulfatase A-like enzyme
LVIKGKNIKNNLRIQANIVDLAPTVLSILDISLPSHMDGRVLEEIFIKKPKIRIEETKNLERGEPEKYLEDDEKEIERRLKDLGYL